MSDRVGRALLHTSTLGVFDVRCSAPAGAAGRDESAHHTQVILPLAGVFEVHHERDTLIADAGSAVVFGTDHPHRIAHPADGGDRSLVLMFPEDVVEVVLGAEGPTGGPVGSPVHAGSRALASGLARDAFDELEAGELALLLLEGIAADLHRLPRNAAAGRHQRDRIEQARALLASEPERRWRLEDVARAVHCSPFHLARQFRALTGTSISRYLLRLRMAIALQRLADGERDLAGLAVDLGFASQSHFGARFRSVFGASPGAVRTTLTSGGLAELRTFLTAQERAAS